MHYTEYSIHMLTLSYKRNTIGINMMIKNVSYVGRVSIFSDVTISSSLPVSVAFHVSNLFFITTHLPVFPNVGGMGI